MDYGLIAILIFFIGYYTFKYIKNKKGLNLLMVFYFVGLALYATKYPIYNWVQESQQKILNISYFVFGLILLLIVYINKNKIKKSYL